MNNKVIIGKEALDSLLIGANKVANAIKTTLGGNGRNVIIQGQTKYPHITKDGVSVANSIHLKDNVERLGASLIQEVASKTLETSGDGTTTASVIAQALINSKVGNPVAFKKEIEESLAQAVETIKSLSKDCKTSESLRKIATISANNDQEVGGIISQAIDRVGADGLIKVEDSKTNQTEVETVDGVSFNRGFVSRYFVTNNEKMTAEFDKPLVLICADPIDQIQHIMPILELVASQNRSLFIVSEQVVGEALQTLAMNHQRGSLKVCVVQAPEYGERRKDALSDLAQLVGAKVISEEAGSPMATITPEHLGSAESVLVTKNSFTITGGSGDISAVVAQLKDKTDDWSKERLAKLQSKVAVIKVGGFSETQIKEKKDRIDDALRATVEAYKGGYVYGGGTALYFASFNVESDILRDAMQAPIKQILWNAGMGAELLESIDYGYGVNVITGEVEKFDHIIDPTNVVINALVNAANISTTFMTTECLIVNEDDNRANS